MNTNLKQIVTAAEAVKKKFRKMRNLESENEITLGNVFKPVVNPLNQISEALKSSEVFKKVPTTSNDEHDENMKFDDENMKFDDENDEFDETIIKKKRKSDNFFTPSQSESEAENENSEQEYEDPDEDEDEAEQMNVSQNSLDNRNTSSWSLSSEYIKEIPFGVRPVQGKLMMGSAGVTITDETIRVGQRKYKKTNGLMELLTKRRPDLSTITKEDTKNYKLMLLETNVHRRNFDPSKPIKSNKGIKYTNIIKPLLNDNKTVDEDQVHGSGLPILKKWKKNVDYVYWDDPNELVERLKLLIASRDAGNTGLDNEILSIIEELNETGLLN